MRIMKYLKNIGMVLLIAGNINCATSLPYLSKEIPEGKYIIIGEGTKDWLEKAINEHNGIKPTLEEACSQADRKPDHKITLQEAQNYYNFVKSNY